MSRDISNVSTTSTLSQFANDCNNEQIEELAYRHTLILILLEYINEPRFMNQNGSSFIERDVVNEVDTNSLNNNRLNVNSSYLRNSSNIRVSNVEDIISEVVVSLGDKLLLVTRNQIKVENDSYKRCLLKFYNDYYLDPIRKKEIKNSSNFEDIIAFFSQSASKELTKLPIDNMSRELFSQITLFVDLLINCLPNNALDEYKSKLSKMKTDFKPNRYKPLSKRYSLIPDSKEIKVGQQITAKNLDRKPTWQMNEISHIPYFMKLFSKSPAMIEADINYLISYISTANFRDELKREKDQLKKGLYYYRIEDFSEHREYRNWENFLLGELAILLDKFPNQSNDTNTNKINVIPKDRDKVYMNVLGKVLQQEYKSSDSTITLSKEATFFIFKCAKYWMLQFPSTIASLFQASLNSAVFIGEVLDIQLVENSSNVLNNMFLKSEVDRDLNLWNIHDRKLWLKTKKTICSKAMRSISILMSAIFEEEQPKFSPYLQFYYTTISSSDIVFSWFIEKSFEDKWVIQLKKSIMKVSESYYLSLVEKLPRDESLEIQHVHDIAEKIYFAVERIQKRYPKLLLEKLNISFISAGFLIDAFATDLKTMLEFVDRFHTKAGKTVAAADGLDCYSAIKDLKEIYVQVNPNEKFPVNLESIFSPYIVVLGTDIKKRLLKVVKAALRNENWEKANANTYYSNSVVDIFKMVNESILIFKKLDWENQYQLSVVITAILKEFVACIKYYCLKMLGMIQEDLKSNSPNDMMIYKKEDEKKTSGVEKMEERPKTWSFHDIKKALKSTPIVKVPAPYEYTRRTCIILNDLDAMLSMMNKLDEVVNAQELSEIISKKSKTDGSFEKAINGEDVVSNNIYTVRILTCSGVHLHSKDGFGNLSVTIIDDMRGKELGATNIVEDTLSPIWDEDFEIEIPVKKTGSLSLFVWNHPDGTTKKSSSNELCGKGKVTLDSKRFPNNGGFSELEVPLIPKGQLEIQISLEKESMDALFCMGNMYRSIERSKEKTIELIVNKFTNVVNHAFSRQTLKLVTSELKHGKGSIEDDETVYDAIVPLFDYLNSNLSILAAELTQELLFEVMLKAWEVILSRANSLLLPPLNTISSSGIINSARKSIWRNSVSSNSSIAGFGRPFTEIEVKIVFMWLDAICVDFFYNNGEGPDLDKLKNFNYKKLLYISQYYNRSVLELKKKVAALELDYDKYLLNSLENGLTSLADLRERSNKISRNATIMDNSSKKNRENAKSQSEKERKDPLRDAVGELEVILRILVTKGEFHFVYKCVNKMNDLRKKVGNKRRAREAALGKRTI
ncbi:Uncharacterized protein RNJ44_02839 [Nakaseomyces bracarensis]|uniref:C2 domain-containing protein n=1 Tax=Nakaseomyces bracarensis TaxID=273131 RepID=A0ABR4P0E0_9SACH